MSGDKAHKRTSLGKIALDGVVRILAVERADANTPTRPTLGLLPLQTRTRLAHNQCTAFTIALARWG